MLSGLVSIIMSLPSTDDETKLLDHLIEFGPDSLELASSKSSQGKRVGGNYGRSDMPLAVNDNLPLAAKPKLFKEKTPVEIKRHFEEFHLKVSMIKDGGKIFLEKKGISQGKSLMILLIVIS